MPTEEENRRIWDEVLTGNWSGVRELLDEYKNIDVNHIRNGNGWTLLHYAAGDDRVDMVQYLVDERHAHIDAQNEDGWTPLLEAA